MAFMGSTVLSLEFVLRFYQRYKKKRRR
jgi:hypothetical protein